MAWEGHIGQFVLKYLKVMPKFGTMVTGLLILLHSHSLEANNMAFETSKSESPIYWLVLDYSLRPQNAQSLSPSTPSSSSTQMIFLFNHCNCFLKIIFLTFLLWKMVCNEVRREQLGAKVGFEWKNIFTWHSLWYSFTCPSYPASGSSQAFAGPFRALNYWLFYLFFR